VKKYLVEILAVLALCLAVVVLVHQHLVSSCPIWFHTEEIFNHEAAASFCVIAAVALVIGKYLGKYLS
jgi:hypothetical protein